jgi:hypothetical protein
MKPGEEERADHKSISSSPDDPEAHEDCEIKLPQQHLFPTNPYPSVNVYSLKQIFIFIINMCLRISRFFNFELNILPHA